MEGKRLIEKIRLLNVLSFGEKVLEKYRNKPERNRLMRPYLHGEEIELLPLNVIIGQNASGKSNFIDVIKLLRSLPQDKGLINLISKSGGINEWIWKGVKTNDFLEIEVQISWLFQLTTYKIRIVEALQRLGIESEQIIEKGHTVNRNRTTKAEDSILSVNETNYRGASYSTVRAAFLNLAIYSDLQITRKSEIRSPKPSDALNDFLAEDGSNLALILDNLNYRGKKPEIMRNLQKFYPQFTDYLTTTQGGTIQLHLREGDYNPISAYRLSDGTLRYLCLLAILCHPEPPPLICIEEPETGLHPDILPTIAELMKEASQRTQLIVTTHSDILVSAFSDMPEAVLVCEKDEDGTHFKRLEAEKLKAWLDEYSLGDLWLKGEIGGTRW
jgi:predicted ATPase